MNDSHEDKDKILPVKFHVVESCFSYNMIGHSHVNIAVSLPGHISEYDGLVSSTTHHLSTISSLTRQEPHRGDAGAVVVQGGEEAVVLASVEHVDESVSAGAGQVTLSHTGSGQTVLQTQNLGIVSLDLTQLVHELELVNSDVARPVSTGQVLTIGTDSDAPHTIPLIIERVLLPSLQRGVRLLDEPQLRVNVQGLEQLLAVDVPPVQGVGGHGGVHVPDSDCVVTAAGHEGSGG